MSDLNADQKEFWSNSAGPKWIALQRQTDKLLKPVLSQLLAIADLDPGQKVLDIGAGTGESCLQAAKAVGTSGHVTGADISETMVSVARKQTKSCANISFVLADVATHDFGSDPFDRVISRFGVMFFVDSRAAFQNIRRSMRPGAKITFATWGGIQENPYFATPARVAKSVIGATPKSDPDAPGPFAFRNPDRVLAILQDSGFSSPRCKTMQLDLDGGTEVAALAACMCEIGPAGAALRHFESSQNQRRQLLDAISESLQVFETPAGIRIPSQFHYFSALA